ncbi:MAG: DUF2132 domain-containing protein [Ignavibacteriae bacterium]|nr:DUF2132 domain-containing protein [Ignavibacteriota bacterium]
MPEQNKDPLHGKTLQMILEHLVAFYGWKELGTKISIKCFTDNPSIKSSLTFLRKTPWAKTKVESLYLYSLRKEQWAAEKIANRIKPPSSIN